MTLLTEQFWRDGYLVLDNFFSSDVMNALDRLIVEHFGENPAFFHTDEFLERSKTEVIPWFPQNDGPSEFDVLNANETLRTLTRDLLGDAWRSLYCMVMFSKEGTVGQAWHQDCSPDPAGQFNLNRLVYTRDIDSSAGGQTVVVPGSHRFGELPPGDPWAPIDDQVVLEPKKGMLIFLHGHTWHRVLPITRGYRFSTNYRAVPNGTPDDVTDVCVYRNMRYRFSTESVIEERT